MHDFNARYNSPRSLDVLLYEAHELPKNSSRSARFELVKKYAKKLGRKWIVPLTAAAIGISATALVKGGYVPQIPISVAKHIDEVFGGKEFQPGLLPNLVVGVARVTGSTITGTLKALHWGVLAPTGRAATYTAGALLGRVKNK